MEHKYSWSTSERNELIVWEDDDVLATIDNEDISDISEIALEELFKEVVYEIRGINIK